MPRIKNEVGFQSVGPQFSPLFLEGNIDLRAIGPLIFFVQIARSQCEVDTTKLI